MSNNNNEEVGSRLDLGGHRARKKQQDTEAFNDWRVTSRMTMTDDLFKTIVAASKGRANIHRTDSNQSVKVYHTDVNANRVRVTKDRRLYRDE